MFVYLHICNKVNIFVKNSILMGSDYINFDTALNTGMRLLKSPKHQEQIMGLYVITAIYTGMRTGDIQKITFEQLRQDAITINEEKTNKRRTITIHPAIHEALKKIGGTGFVFMSQKNQVYTTQALNRLLKNHFKQLAKKNNISTHSLRKTFGRRVYDNAGQSEHALVALSELFAHSNIQVTRIYLGLKQEELRDIYLSL